jgi:hypothetical protein
MGRTRPRTSNIKQVYLMDLTEWELARMPEMRDIFDGRLGRARHRHRARAARSRGELAAATAARRMAHQEWVPRRRAGSSQTGWREPGGGRGRPVRGEHTRVRDGEKAGREERGLERRDHHRVSSERRPERRHRDFIGGRGGRGIARPGRPTRVWLERTGRTRVRRSRSYLQSK